MRIKILSAVMLAGISGLSLYGCATTVSQGKTFDTAHVDEIKDGVTTKDQVVQWFGMPMSKNTTTQGEEWNYFSQNFHQSSPGLLGRKAMTQQISQRQLYIIFKDNVVKSHNYREMN